MLIRDLLHVLNPFQNLVLYFKGEIPEIHGLCKENFAEICPQYLDSPIIEMWSEAESYDNVIVIVINYNKNT